MLSSTLRGILAGSLSLSLLTGGRAANPYQSRLDREYKSLSNAISRAYSPPPPAPTRSYTSSSFSSSSSYSSSSNRRNSSPSSYSSSSSSRSNSYTNNYASSAAESRASRAALSQVQAEAKKRNSPFSSTRVAPASASPAQTAARNVPSASFVEWNLYRTRLEGRAPLVEPPDRALQSRRSEFEYFSTIARREGKKAPWENMRAGQLCLLAQGDEATPERAFAFFVNSDPSWIEVQYGLGVCYLRGYGVTADPAKAREHLELAAKTPPKPRSRYVAGGELVADPGFEAARDLGIAYDLGLGQPANPRLALTWIEIADARPLVASDREQLKALRVEFWRRHHGDVRTIIEQDFAAVKAGGASVLTFSFLPALIAVGDAQALFEAGDLLDTRNPRGEEKAHGRSGMPFFLAAAKLGHEPAARRFFSPATNGSYDVDLAGGAYWAERAEFAAQTWPKWEKLWLEAAAKGDASAHLPLAFHYSGLRGNLSVPKRAEEHLAQLPASLPPAQRTAVIGGLRLGDSRSKEEWIQSVWTRFGTTPEQVDLSALGLKPDPVDAAARRDEANALPPSESKRARDLWRDAAALGDLPALVSLWLYAKRNQMNFGSRFDASLQARLEKASRAGDAGATAALAVLMDASAGNSLHLSTATYTLGRSWRAATLLLAPQRARFLEVAENGRLIDTDVAARREAALDESRRWTGLFREWGLTGHELFREVTLSDEQVMTVDARRAQFVAVAELDTTLRAQLGVWERADDLGFDAEADARFVQALETWYADDPTERDPVRVLDYLAQASGLGHPIAPLAIASYYSTGHGGLPADPAVGRRFRALADARLTALAEADDRWAQTVLGNMLVEGGSDENKRVTAFEWLPGDHARGLRWLEQAAREGAALPRSFGDSSGHTVAFYLSSYYYTSGDLGSWCKWGVVDRLYRVVDSPDETSDNDWKATHANVQKLLAEKPDVWVARAALDKAIDQADDENAQAKALFARAQVNLDLGLVRLALFDAEQAGRMNLSLPSSWRAVAPYQRVAGETTEAALSIAVADALEQKPGAIAAFESAFRQVDAERRTFLQFAFSANAEEPNATAALKALAESATRISPPQ